MEIFVLECDLELGRDVVLVWYNIILKMEMF